MLNDACWQVYGDSLDIIQASTAKKIICESIVHDEIIEIIIKQHPLNDLIVTAKSLEKSKKGII